MSVRLQFSRIPFLAYLLAIPALGQTQQPKPIIEPFKIFGALVRFDGEKHVLAGADLEQLNNLANRLGDELKAGRIHECDFNQFVIEGSRSSELGSELQRLDSHFEERVAYIRNVFLAHGIPAHLAVSIRPSELRPTDDGDLNAISIYGRYWVHQANANIEKEHIECKLKPW